MKKKIFVTALVIILIFALIMIFRKDLLKIAYPKKFEQYVNKYAEEYNIDKNLILAVIKAESNFEAEAESNKGAKGLMQLMEDTAKEIAPEAGIEISEENIGKELLTPEININLGTKYLQILIERYKNTPIALTAYNAGSR